MTNHPITPPPELVQQWGHNANLSGVPHNDEHWAYEQHIANRAAQWGADQQLTKDAEWLNYNTLNEPHLRITPMGESLKEAMRPKPPSLKEQALEGLTRLVATGEFFSDQMKDLDTIRRALEEIDD
jgi:hypothetical protein